MAHIGPRGFYKRDCTNDVKIWGTLRLYTENLTLNPKPEHPSLKPSAPSPRTLNVQVLSSTLHFLPLV